MIFVTTVATVGHKIKKWQACQEADGTVTFRYVPGPGFDPSVETHVQQSLARYLAGVSVVAKQVDDITPGPNGKHRLVIAAPAAAGSRPGT
jgi:hypothetical protein